MKTLTMKMLLTIFIIGIALLVGSVESSAKDNPYVLTDAEKANNALARVMGRVEPHVAPAIVYHVSGDTRVTHGNNDTTVRFIRDSYIRDDNLKE